MKKVKVILFVVLIIAFTISTSLWAMRRGSVGGEFMCYDIAQQEDSILDHVTCSYFSYSDPGFHCPDDAPGICYGCTCVFESGVTITTRACECQF